MASKQTKAEIATPRGPPVPSSLVDVEYGSDGSCTISARYRPTYIMFVFMLVASVFFALFTLLSTTSTMRTAAIAVYVLVLLSLAYVGMHHRNRRRRFVAEFVPLRLSPLGEGRILIQHAEGRRTVVPKGGFAVRSCTFAYRRFGNNTEYYRFSQLCLIDPAHRVRPAQELLSVHCSLLRRHERNLERVLAHMCPESRPEVAAKRRIDREHLYALFDL